MGRATDTELIELTKRTYRELYELARVNYRTLEGQIRFMLATAGPKRRPLVSRRKQSKNTWTPERREAQRKRMSKLQAEGKMARDHKDYDPEAE